MSLWNHPRLTAALCTVAVLGCAAAPAVFLAAADAASLGRVETVADPYVAPTPTADDYYILRQLAARSRNAESEREQRRAEVLTAPKMYIGASASLQSMQYADSAAEAAENALRQLAETGAVPAAWAAEALDTAETGESYTDWDGKYYSLDATYCVTDSLGFVTVRRFGMTDNALFTRYSVTMDSRTGTVVEAWLSMAGTDAENTPLPTETALRSFAAQAGLESLGDWAAPADSPYGCALYSTNGGALITASTHPYTYQDYVGTAPVSSDRWYYSLTLQLRTEDQLPGEGQAPAAANNSPCLPPWGKVAPQGRMRGRLPLPPIPGQTVGGRRPRRPAKACADVLPRVTTRGDSRCRQHPRRGQDPSLRTEPWTGVRVPPRAGQARPLPHAGPGTAARVNPTVFPYPHP